ncbi:MAG: divergent PAP2 family protein [Clostridia bacterium]|nr:divergent PAP2 family protein [Clostridia bacterium]
MKLIWNIISDFLNNNIILVTLISWFIAQVVKVIVNAAVNKKWSLERLIGDGGMPSCHSATVCSAATACGWVYGFDSVVFAVAFVIAIVVMHDATGVRRETGKQATVIKEIADVINTNVIDDDDEDINIKKLKELVGHTPLQVVAGAVLGVVISLLLIAIGGVEYHSGMLISVLP